MSKFFFLLTVFSIRLEIYENLTMSPMFQKKNFAITSFPFYFFQKDFCEFFFSNLKKSIPGLFLMFIPVF